MTPLVCFESHSLGSLGVPNKYFTDIRVNNCFKILHIHQLFLPKPIHLQIVDDNQQECGQGIPGHLAIKIKRKKPVGLFSGISKRCKKHLKNIHHRKSFH